MYTFKGFKVTMMRYMSLNSFCFSVRSFEPLCTPNWSMNTPTKERMTKKEPTMIKMTKKMAFMAATLRCGCMNSSFTSMAWYMTSSHSSSVAVSKRVKTAFPIQSKL